MSVYKWGVTSTLLFSMPIIITSQSLFLFFHRLSAGYKMLSANDYKPSDSRNVVLNFYTGGGNLFTRNVFKLLKDAF